MPERREALENAVRRGVRDRPVRDDLCDIGALPPHLVSQQLATDVGVRADVVADALDALG